MIAAQVGERVAIVDSATATASALAELLSVNGLEDDRARSRGDAPPILAAPGTPARPSTLSRPLHVQLTTGDPEQFHALASRLFGSDFPDVEQVELAVAAR